jgi:hypothetical protein
MGLYKEIERKIKKEKPLSTNYWKQGGNGHPVKCKIGGQSQREEKIKISYI